MSRGFPFLDVYHNVHRISSEADSSRRPSSRKIPRERTDRSSARNRNQAFPVKAPRWLDGHAPRGDISTRGQCLIDAFKGTVTWPRPCRRLKRTTIFLLIPAAECTPTKNRNPSFEIQRTAHARKAEKIWPPECKEASIPTSALINIRASNSCGQLLQTQFETREPSLNK